jgi:hypothetical protein
MSLTDNVHRLTREHLTRDKDGNLRSVPAFLDELRGAITPGNSMSGGGASGPPIPINPSAVDLLTEIHKEARRDYHEITGNGWPGNVDSLLVHFAAMNLTPEWDSYLTHVTTEWLDRITAMLWPVKPRRKLTGKVCPACGQATHGDERAVTLSLGCWDDDGAMRAIGTWDITCEACGAEWAGDQVAYLLRALDTPNAKVVSEVAEVAEVV